jgi:glycosyltransferase involved in cell wall biosynthesis
MKVLFLTSTPPIPSWGGAMTFYRHFCDRHDFQIHVITDNPQVTQYEVPYDYSLINHGKLWRRLARTRLHKAVHSWGHLVGTWKTPETVLQQAKDFGAEAVFTVAGSWSWMAKMAEDVASRLNIPLVGSFNDWWSYNSIRYNWLDSLLENNFKQFYQRCNLALCTSEGMQEALGNHANSIVLYPTGAAISNQPNTINTATNKPFTVAFAGNLGDWYGKMLESVVSLNREERLKFKFFGSNASWSDNFDRQVRETRIYQGQIPFERLTQEIEQVDALLLLMGFEESCSQIERTSFKTKFLDYLSFRKPILLWGPDYCSAVRIAREFDSAEICTSSKAVEFLSTILRVSQNSDRQKQLVTNAHQMYEERFHPDKLHQLLVTKMQELLV